MLVTELARSDYDTDVPGLVLLVIEICPNGLRDMLEFSLFALEAAYFRLQATAKGSVALVIVSTSVQVIDFGSLEQLDRPVSDLLSGPVVNSKFLGVASSDVDSAMAEHHRTSVDTLVGVPDDEDVVSSLGVLRQLHLPGNDN